MQRQLTHYFELSVGRNEDEDEDEDVVSNM